MRKMNGFQRHPADHCPICGGLMCLVASEPHPVHPRTDVLRFACTGCAFTEEATVSTEAKSA
jgi:hypothetical protein